jgi:hypothetical protein
MRSSARRSRVHSWADHPGLFSFQSQANPRTDLSRLLDLLRIAEASNRDARSREALALQALVL